jgi:hypothetical protein
MSTGIDLTKDETQPPADPETPARTSHERSGLAAALPFPAATGAALGARMPVARNDQASRPRPDAVVVT